MHLSDWELWSAANMVLREHGDQAPRFVAERIGALAIDGDTAGIEVWRAIAARLDALSTDDPHSVAH